MILTDIVRSNATKGTVDVASYICRFSLQKDLIIAYGMAFISERDFEYQNFNSDELARILLEMSLDEGAPVEDEEKFLKIVSSAKNGKELTVKERTALPNFQNLAKGKKWGERLLGLPKTTPILNAKDKNRSDHL